MSIKERKENLTLKQKQVLSIVVFIAFLIFCGAVAWFIGRPMIRFVSEPEKFRDWVASHGFLGKLSFVIMMVFQVVIALVPGEPLEIGAGYAFGALEGTLLCVIGISIGSIIVFALVRKFGIRLVEVFFSYEKIRSLRFLKKSRKRDVIMFLIFFLPGTPKDLITYFAGITDVKLKNFLILASIARLPSVITSTLGGSALGLAKYETAVLVFAVTLVISLLGWFIYTFLQKRKENNKKEK